MWDEFLFWCMVPTCYAPAAAGLTIAGWYYWPSRGVRKRWASKFILVPLVIAISVYEAVLVSLVLLRGLT